MFNQSRIVEGNNSSKELRAYSIATSRGSPAELDVFLAWFRPTQNAPHSSILGRPEPS